MAVKVNLLPENLIGKKGTTKVASVVKSITLVSFFLISSLTLKNLESDLDNLKTQIKAQETTEQRLVLLKDRLAKIKTTLTTPSVSGPLVGIKPILDSTPSEVSLSELNIDASKVDTSMIFRDSASLTNFFERLTNFKGFSRVTLTSFGFNPTAGYLVGIRFSL